MLTLTDAMKLCLISNAEPVRAAVRASCLPPHEVEIFSLEGFLNPDNTLSAYGASVVEAATKADAVLIGWSMEQAPMINTICFSVRSTKTFVPVIALSSGSQEEMIAALAAGVDDVTSFPLYVPLFQARVVAHHRLVKSVQRATATRIKKKLQAKQHTAREQAEGQADALVEDIVDELEEQIEARDTAHLLSGDGHFGEVVEHIAHALEAEADQFVGALIENVAEAMVEEVDDELELVDLDHDVTEAGPLRLNRTAYRVYIEDDEVELTPKEFELLSFLMERVGELCTRDQILDHVWGIDFDTGTNMVDVYMHFIRKKLAAHGLDGALQTIRGRGYRLTVSDVETT